MLSLKTEKKMTECQMKCFVIVSVFFQKNKSMECICDNLVTGRVCVNIVSSLKMFVLGYLRCCLTNYQIGASKPLSICKISLQKLLKKIGKL